MKTIKLISRILLCIWGSCIAVPFVFFILACIFMMPIGHWVRWAGKSSSETLFALFLFLVFGVGALLLFGYFITAWFKLIRYFLKGG